MDPFLNLHQIGTLPVFDLASGLTRISIRDQMVRGRMLGDRLPAWLSDYYATRGLNHIEHPVLIVGAGAYGVTAAALLALAGNRVVVAERRSIVFPAQATCDSRWLDPTQYDWPMDHWRRAKLPWLAASLPSWPLPWKADRASSIVKNQWGSSLARLQRRHGIAARLQLLFSTLIDPHTNWRTDGLEVKSTDLRSRTDRYQAFSSVVWAIGFGQERCKLGSSSPHFWGVPFWTTDPFEQDHSGVTGEADVRDTVLISGSGDGALQDLIRVLTRRKTAREVFDALSLQPLFEQMGQNLLTLVTREWQYERALNWCTAGDRTFAARYLSDLHEQHESVVTEVLLRGGATLSSKLEQLALRRPVSTTLVTTTNAFSCLYALNRFIALLLLRALRPAGDVLVERGRRVLAVTSASMPAASTPIGCIGHDWDVELEDVSTGHKFVVNANVVILRHGIEPHDTSLPVDPRVLPRPAPPTHVF